MTENSFIPFDKSITENAQRLGDVILPRMLGDLVKHDDQILLAREALKNERVFPNSTAMRKYKELLPKLQALTNFTKNCPPIFQKDFQKNYQIHEVQEVGFVNQIKKTIILKNDKTIIFYQ